MDNDNFKEIIPPIGECSRKFYANIQKDYYNTNLFSKKICFSIYLLICFNNYFFIISFENLPVYQ